MEDRTKRYSLNEEKRKSLQAIFLMNIIINKRRYYSVLLEREDKNLEPILDALFKKEYIKINEKNQYVPTEKGRNALQNFMKRYQDYRDRYSLFAFVDLTAGEFAYSSYYDKKFEGDAGAKKWSNFLDQERWTDCQIAVTEYLNLDPIEIVFMSKIDGDLDVDSDNWQFNLLSGELFQNIIDICNSNYSWTQLGENETDDSVIKDIIQQGNELMLSLKKQEGEYNKAVEEANRLAEEEYNEAVEANRLVEEEEYVVVEEVVEEVIEEDVIYVEDVRFETRSYMYYNNLYRYNPYYVAVYDPWW